MEIMAKNDWPQLRELYLGHLWGTSTTEIGDQGSAIVLNLKKEKWERLQLCKYFIIQIIAESLPRDLDPCLSSPRWNSNIYI